MLPGDIALLNGTGSIRCEHNMGFPIYLPNKNNEICDKPPEEAIDDRYFNLVKYTKLKQMPKP